MSEKQHIVARCSVVLQHHFGIGGFEVLRHTGGHGESSWPVRHFMEVSRRTLSWIRLDCAAAARLRRLHERFASCFGRHECREHSLGYLRGLLLAEGRKSIEPMALVFGGPSGVEPEIDQSIVLSWQRFLTVSPWEAQAVQREIQAVFNEEFVPTARVGDRHGGRDRRVEFCQTRLRERWGPTAMVWTAGQGRELPSGGFLAGCHSGRQRPVGSPALPAQALGRGPRAAEEDSRAHGNHVPDQAGDRRGASRAVR